MKPVPPAARKVLVVGPTPPPVGGDSVTTRRLLSSRYWEEHGLEPVHVETSHGGAIRTIGDPMPASDIVRGLGVIGRVVRKIRGVDALLGVMNTRFLCTAGIPVIASARIAGRPVVLRIVGSSLPDRLRRLNAPSRALVVRTLAGVDRLFPQTEETCEELAGEFGLPRERIVRLPNYVADVAGDAVRTTARFAGRCVFVGQVKREKGVFDVIAAVAGAEKYLCDIYGPVLERDRRELFAAIGSASNVHYRGVLDPDEVRRTIARYDVLLLPSYHQGEGYPGVILEAFAAGVPVIAGIWRSIPRLLADGDRGMLVPVKAPQRIRDALERLGSDEALYSRLSSNARSYVGAFTERAAVGEILLAQIRGLVDGSHRGAGP